MKTRKVRYWSLRSYASYLSKFKAPLIGVAAIFVLSNVLITLTPILVGKLVDSLTNQTDPWLFVWLLIATSILHDITWQIANIAYRRYLLQINFDYGTLLFRHVITKPFHYFTNRYTGKVSSYVTKIADDMRNFLSETYFAYLSQIIGIISVVIILGSVNWQTAVLFVLSLAIMIFVGKPILQRAAQADRVETDVASTRTGHIVDSIGNFASVKAFQKESSEIREVDHHQQATLKAARKGWIWGQSFWWSQSIVVRWILWPGVILMNIVFYFDGSISLGQLTTIISTALIFTNTVWDTVWSVSQITLKLARIEEAYIHLFGEVVITEKTTKRDRLKATFHEQIALQNISFAYPEKPEDHVLRNINIAIRRGEKVGIVGKSGSGKSTLSKLLVGYYKKFEGAILLDDRPVKSSVFSKLVSFVPQDTGLFHRSIADNIAYAADGNVSREEVIKAAKQAQAHEFIERIDGGYEALVGERGVKLSGGQRQRIAIARAILKDSPILILDEATSALDSESEILVQKALEELWDNKTALVIAHRLSTIAKLDRIIVLNEGEIVQQGTHAELIKQDGVYAKLWKHQSGGFIDE